MNKTISIFVIIVLLTTGFVPSAGAASEVSTFNGSLTNDASYTRPAMPGDILYETDGDINPQFSKTWLYQDNKWVNSIDTDEFFEYIPGEADYTRNYFKTSIIPRVSGTYNIMVKNAEFEDSTLFLYKGDFNSAEPLLNLVAGNDDIDGETFLSSIEGVELQAYKLYNVVMSSFDINITGSFSFEITGDGKVDISDPFGPPGLESTANTATTATFSWTSAVGATAIELQQSPAGLDDWTPSSTTETIATDAVSATVEGLTPGASYDFRLEVTGGTNSGISNIVSLTTAPPPDSTSPTVTSVNVPADGSYRENQTLTFTVNTDEAVTVTGTPSLALTIGDTARTANYTASGSTGTALKFAYTVQAGDSDTDGIEIGELSLNSGSIEDTAGNDLELTLSSIGDTSGITIDTTAPTVTGVDVPADKTYLAGEALTFTVNVSEPVTVTGTPNLGLTVGGASRTAAYTISGSSETAMTFTYSIQAGDTDADGIEVGTLALNGGTIKDFAGNDLVLTLNGLGDTEDVLVDAVAPTVTSVDVPASKTYLEGETLTFTVNVSEAVSVTGTPSLGLTIGGASRSAAYSASDITDTELTFSYTVQAGDADSDGIAIGSLALNSGAIVDDSGNALALTLNSVGDTTGVLVDAASPTVTSVSVPANKIYVEGETLTFTVNVSEPVSVTGSPSLALTIGDESQTAIYTSSGSTGMALKFAYTVQAGDVDLDGIEVGALALNGGAIQDNAGNELILTLASVGDTGGVQVDTTVPKVTSISVPASGTYRAGQTLTFTVNVNKPVTVTGSPSLDVTIGSESRTAVYTASGSTGTALKFTYTVQAGDLDTDGIEVGALTLSGDTIKDGAGNDLNLSPDSIGDTEGVRIDTMAPAVTSVNVPASKTYLAGEALTLTVNVSEAVSVAGTPNISLTIGSTSRMAEYTADGSTGTALKFTYIVQAGELDANGITIGTLSLSGGTIEDAAGNAMDLILNSVESTSAVLVDAVVPTVISVGVPTSKTYIEGETLTFTVNVSEAVTVTGTPRLGLTVGSASRTAAYTTSGSTNTALKFAYTVQAGDADSDGIEVGALTPNGGTIVDSSGNELVLTLNSVGNMTGVLADAEAPTVTSVNVPADKTYVAGETLTFTVNVSEPVTVTGSPSLALAIGDESQAAVYTVSGSTDTAFKFAYEVQAGDMDLDGVEIGALTLSGGTIKDDAGNDLILTLASVGNTEGVQVDTAVPTVTNISVPASGSYRAGQTLTFTVIVSKPVTVTGTPNLALVVGGESRIAVYSAIGSTGTALKFAYAVQAGDADTDGIEVGALSPNGGTIKDSTGIDLILTPGGIGDSSGVRIDTAAPSMLSASRLDDTHIVVTLTENLTGLDAPNDGGFTVAETGGIATYAVTAVAQGADARHAVLTVANMGISAKEGVTVKYTAGGNGTVADLAGNALASDIAGVAVPQWDTSGPSITGSSVDAGNKYVDLTFSEGVYGTDQGTGAIAKEDLQLVFTSGSGATAAIIGDIKKSDHAEAASAGALTGGETTIRVFLTVTGADNGTGKIEIKPADGSSLYDKAGNAALASVTTGQLALKNTQPPVNNTPPPTTTEDDGVAVIVNGVKQDKTASAKVTTVDNKKVTTITVDEQKLNEKLQTVDPGYKVTIPVNNQSDVIVGELNAQMVKNMESKQAVLEVQTEKASYTLPAIQLNVDDISRKVGSAVALDDIKIRVEISNVDDKEVKFIPQPDSAIALIAPAIEFRITAVHGGQTVNVDKFNAYVERTIAIPDGVDPNKITTGIVVQPDGTIVHVPTKVVEQSGRYFAVINSLTNSVYSVIYNEKTFDDIRTHWAKADIEDMASRLVIAGKSEAKFAPEADITRAEFTAIMVRALGLRIADGESLFSDVKSGEWYASAVQIAVSYGLIEGYEDGTFRPNDSITREHAMVIIARAMKLMNMDMELSADQQAESIATFSDRGSISGWAKQSVALNVYHEIFRGNDNRLEPQDNISRAETAAIVRKLLQQAGLIND